ncbi:hypothetical protein C6T66_10595 [Burkholderia multivorans]|uniref:Uncharacterized protein n=1 Tax=Burkholderia multivorans TaxID=87883 RepID=A0A8E2UTL8_9BURK|nr:hypothetical protein C6P76_08730 [Burkholderia multivorans]PRE21913.1 hypothetical protein C6P79_28895 [Burkholderia multivorans]PRF17675.1 hypothetical protein C6P98_29210 [Burkholderia multivorans]PRG88295.1 hypothetical protein C6T66_10595 [Burkholderia multivorans]
MFERCARDSRASRKGAMRIGKRSRALRDRDTQKEMQRGRRDGARAVRPCTAIRARARQTIMRPIR